MINIKYQVLTVAFEGAYPHGVILNNLILT